MDNLLNDYEHRRRQKPQTGRPRNGFIQKWGDHFDRFVTNRRPKTATPGVAGSLTDTMEMHLHVWRVSRVQNAHGEVLIIVQQVGAARVGASRLLASVGKQQVTFRIS